jgi:hypothetical protein
VVVVTQPIQQGARHEVLQSSVTLPLALAGMATWPTTLVGSCLVEVFLVLLYHTRKVPLAQVQKAVQAFATHAARKLLQGSVQP